MTEKEELEELRFNIKTFQKSLEFAVYLAEQQGHRADANTLEMVLDQGKYCEVFEGE